MDRRTKIVATIGPRTESVDSLEKMSDVGANVFRLNFSHGTHEWHGKIIDRIREIGKRTGREHAIILDTKGPEIRTTDLPVPVNFASGDTMTLTVDHSEYKDSGKIGVNYDAFIDDVDVGDRIYIDNGVMELEVIQKTKVDVICKVLDGGQLSSRRHINLPGRRVSLDSVTEKDWHDIAFGIEKGIDFIALSFVRGPEEIEEVKRFVESKGKNVSVIAKIETSEAANDLENIIEAADGVMVARGDLGAEVELATLPRIQRNIIKIASQKRKPVIVATHMLESMIHNPLPTRAEVTDIFYAVWWRADGIMLSGETAMGDFPLKSVKIMDRIAKETEMDVLVEKKYRNDAVAGVHSELSKLSAQIAEDLDDIEAIMVFTRSGRTSRLVSSFRPRVPVWAFTDNIDTMRKNTLLWGVKTYVSEFSRKDPEITVQNARNILLEENPHLAGEKYVLISDTLVDGKFIPMIQMRTL